MNIFLVGPSSIGKTALAKSACDGKEMLHVNLDNLVTRKNGNVNLGTLIQQNGDPWLWEQYLKIIEEVNARFKFHRKKLIFDMRASVLSLPEARAYLSGQTTVALSANPGEVFVKVQQRGQKISYFDWEQIEFSPERRKFYDSCEEKVDISDLNETEAVDKLRAALDQIGKGPSLIQADAEPGPEDEDAESETRPTTEEKGPEVSLRTVENKPEPAEARPAPASRPEPVPKTAPRKKNEPKSAPGLEKQPLPKGKALAIIGILVVVAAVVFYQYYFPKHRSEAPNYLLEMQEKEKAYYAANHKYATTFAELDWKPDPKNVRFYAYFMSPTEVLQPGWTQYPLPQGFNASVTQNSYQFVAVGKLHDNPTLDVWSIDPSSGPVHLQRN